jgi:hypothetical protein
MRDKTAVLAGGCKSRVYWVEQVYEVEKVEEVERVYEVERGSYFLFLHFDLAFCRLPLPSPYLRAP